MTVSTVIIIISTKRRELAQTCSPLSMPARCTRQTQHRYTVSQHKSTGAVSRIGARSKNRTAWFSPELKMSPQTLDTRTILETWGTFKANLPLLWNHRWHSSRNLSNKSILRAKGHLRCQNVELWSRMLINPQTVGRVSTDRRKALRQSAISLFQTAKYRRFRSLQLWRVLLAHSGNSTAAALVDNRIANICELIYCQWIQCETWNTIYVKILVLSVSIYTFNQRNQPVNFIL